MAYTHLLRRHRCTYTGCTHRAVDHLAVPEHQIDGEFCHEHTLEVLRRYPGRVAYRPVGPRRGI